MAVLKIHPSCLELEPLTEYEYKRLEASILLHGCRVPVIVWQQYDKASGEVVGWIMDGRHRFDICTAHKKHLPSVIIDVANEQAAIAIGQSLNDDRRHRTQEQRDARLEKVKAAREDGKSIRQISESTKVSPTQVRRDLEVISTVPGGAVEPKDGKIVGKDGKKRGQKAKTKKPPKPPAPVVVPPDAGDAWEPPSEEETKREQDAERAAREIRDALGFVVPKKLRDTFADTFVVGAISFFDMADQHLRDNMNLYPWALMEKILEAINTAKTHIANCKPYAVHQACEAKGCDQCRATGYVPEWRHFELAEQA